MLNGFKTYIGLLVAAVPTVAGLFGYDASVAFPEEFAAALVEVVTIAGLCIAFYGRLVAQVPGWFAKRQ